LIFVEVKARESFADAEWSITPQQRQRIVAAAESWLARNPDQRIRDMRFDAVLVAPRRLPRHIPAAFDADIS
jgi:putative endonuclease